MLKQTRRKKLIAPLSVHQKHDPSAEMIYKSFEQVLSKETARAQGLLLIQEAKGEG
jgi:hypothetical protein